MAVDKAPPPRIGAYVKGRGGGLMVAPALLAVGLHGLPS